MTYHQTEINTRYLAEAARGYADNPFARRKTDGMHRHQSRRAREQASENRPGLLLLVVNTYQHANEFSRYLTVMLIQTLQIRD